MATVRLQSRSDTLANWTTENPILGSGEHGLETDTGYERIGDGSTAFLSLPRRYGGYIVYDDYAAFEASTEASRGIGVIWDYGDGRGTEAVSGDISNSAATPVQLDVLPDVGGNINIKAWGGVEGGTDNGTMMQDAIDALAANGGGVVKVAGGRWKFDPFTLKAGVFVEGVGRVPHANYLAANYNGTSLLVTGLVSDNCVSTEENVLGLGMRNLSVFDDGAAAINAVMEIKGVLEPVLDDVELQSLTTSRGAGLSLDVGSSFETLYSKLHFVTSFCDVGLQINDDCNANTFNGCRIQGITKSIKFTGAVNPAGNKFNGGAVEATYSASMEHIFLTAADAQKMVDWQGPVDSYIVVWIDIERGRKNTFSGVYFELGGTPATYDDGVNGVHNLASAIRVRSNAEGTSFVGCDMNTFIYDEGLATLADPTTFRKEYSNRDRPSACFRNNSAQSIAGFTLVDVDLAVALINDPTTMKYDSSSKALTVFQDGVYRIYGQVTFDPIAFVGDFCYANLTTSGGTFRGPNIPIVNTTGQQGRSVSCLVALNRGDTVKLQCFQGTGVAETLSASQELTFLTIEKV